MAAYLSDGAARRTLSPEELRELRHELRTPLNLIIGYCEMLLEDSVDAGLTARQAPLERTLGAARDVVDLVNTSLAPSRTDVGPDDLERLNAVMLEPQQRMLAETATLLASAGPGARGQFESDVRCIQSAAERLLVVATQPTAASSAIDRHPVPPGIPSAGSEAGTASADDTAPRGPRPAHILVVDDIADNRNVLERRLRRQGHEVSCATGGYDALAQVARTAFDLVLLDVMMPDLDGHAVLERLKSTPATRDIPVIMISALDDVATVVRCIERGAEDHLPKPFDPVLLRARINACLEKKRLRDAELDYLEQVNVVIDAARAVEAGAYTAEGLASVARRPDELGRLARVFDAMVAQVRAREDRLHSQIGALRREIQEARRATEPGSANTVQHALPTGRLFADRYEILEETGSGGMGIVYRAFDRQLGEPVAIKTLRQELLADPDALERFKSEIRLARHISHRNVVRIHDIGEAGGVYYLTMEYVEGITVRELLDTRGRLSVAATLAIAAQLAHSLAVAHEQAIIHRDIKPENLLVDADGVLKVMDFGVARLAERTSSITHAGMVVGTPAYMAPEQLLSEEVDARCDLYAMGVVLYECLTGRRPFDATSPFVLVARVLKDSPPSPAVENPTVPPALAELVLRLLAKERSARPTTATEVASLLADVA